MKIYLIAARSLNNVIGNNGEIPWRVKGEQKLFREITLGSTLVMGRKTFESIGRPLPGRDTIIVTRRDGYRQKACTTASSIEHAVELAAGLRGDCYIAGGGEVYRQSIHLADGIHLTTIHLQVEGEITFPEMPAAEFQLEREILYRSNIDYTYQFFRRIARPPGHRWPAPQGS